MGDATIQGLICTEQLVRQNSTCLFYDYACAL